MNTESKINRRNFFRRAGAYTAMTAMSTTWLSEIMAAKPKIKKTPKGAKVKVGAIGIGFRGKEVMREFEKTGLCDFVALCDVDMGAKHTLDMMNAYPNAPRYQDFRRMIDEMIDSIEAVLICTPDFAHFPATMYAMSKGLNVYIEKPMAHTFQECELLMAGAHKFGVVTQMGNQGHSEANYFQFKAWKESGIIKDVTAITAHMNNSRRWHSFPPSYMTAFPPSEPIPSTMNWDVWLGTEQHHDYCKDFVNGQWRCWYDFGMGCLGDWGAHIIDTAHEFLELGYPTEIQILKATNHNRFVFPNSSTILFRFAARKNMPPVDITWYDGTDNYPPLPKGYGESDIDPNIPTVAGQQIQRQKLNPGKEIYSKTLTFKGGSHGSTLTIIPEEKAQAMQSKLPKVPNSTSNHFANFLKACRGEEKTRSPFEIAGPLSQVFCLGVIAQQLNTTIKFDAKTKQITNNAEANNMLIGAAPRKEWEKFYKL